MKNLTTLLSHLLSAKSILPFIFLSFFAFNSFAENNKGYTCTASISVTPLSATICIGSSVTLTASGGATYSWSTGETTSSISVSPAYSMYYTVFGTDSNGCTATDTIQITVDNPNVSASSSQNLICAGANTTLNASIEGGFSPYTYAWSPMSWLTCSPMACASPIANPPGTINYTTIITDANGCTASASVTVNVDNIYVETSVNPSSACQGSTIVLSASVLGGAHPFTYLWSPGTASGLTDSIVAPPTGQATYTFTVSDSNGCSASATALASTDNFSVFLPPTMSICAGHGGTSATGSLSALYPLITPGASPYTYSWSTGSTSAWLPLAGLPSGIYSVSITDANGCTATATDTLTVHIPPQITITSSRNPIQIGWVDTLTVSGGIGYYWSNGQTGNQIIVRPRTTTGYSVYGWDSNGCGSNIGTTIIVSRDYWMPSPDTMIPHLKNFPPIYFAGNISVGKDSGASPHQALEVHGNTIIDSSLSLGNSMGQGLSLDGNTSTITSPNKNINFANDTIFTTGMMKSGNLFASGNILMPGIVLDTNTDLMSIDRHGRVKPATLSSLISILWPNPNVSWAPCYGQPSPPGPFPFSYNPVSNGPGVWEIYPCVTTGFGSFNPDAIVSINATQNPSINAFSIGASSISGANTATGTLTDVFDISGTGSTTMGIPLGNGDAFLSISGNYYTGQEFSIISPFTNNDVFTTDTYGNTYIDGKVGIGIPFSDMPGNYRLYVKGGVLTEHCRVGVDGSGDWSDTVFSRNYNLSTLDSVADYIQKNQHLKDIPTSGEVVKNGIDVAKMDALLLKKIEELTLYVIQLKKENEDLKKEIEKK